MEIPKEVKLIIEELQKKGFEAYAVGGCVRDLLLGKEPEDWDITTNAKPEEIQKLFPKSFYENNFLTVTVLTGSKDSKLSELKEDQSSFPPLPRELKEDQSSFPPLPRELKEDKSSFRSLANVREIEVTTYRQEAKYTDKRHPDEIKFAKSLDEDLARRDFTVNAIALNEETGAGKQEIKIIDLFGGQKDLKDKIIRAVGDPEERFSEDALRMMRAVRFATTLEFEIEKKTAKAIEKNAPWLQAISKERIRDELMKIVMADRAADGVELLRKLGLLKYVIPELEEGYGVGQNKHHVYECYEHNLRAFDFAAKQKFNKFVRLASLLHDIGKPKTKRGEGADSTFYGHEIVGAQMTAQILNRLKFSKKDIEKIVKLVRYHLFYYNVDEVSESSVRRLVRQAGPESMEELLQVRMADRIGSGVPKAEPYKLRHLKYVIDKVSQDPISAKMLKVSGNDVMKDLDIKPGPKVGHILDVLLGIVLADPGKNEKDFLKKEVQKLGKLSDVELASLSQKSKKEREKIETKRDEMTKAKYWVT